jgi:hypothetical protein
MMMMIIKIIMVFMMMVMMNILNGNVTLIAIAKNCTGLQLLDSGGCNGNGYIIHMLSSYN